jgi:hypothetical protein
MVTVDLVAPMFATHQTSLVRPLPAYHFISWQSLNGRGGEGVAKQPTPQPIPVFSEETGISFRDYLNSLDVRRSVNHLLVF